MKRNFLQKLLSPLNDISYFYLSTLNPERAFLDVRTHYITGILPIIGYGIFFASLVDCLHALFPLQLQNVPWELQTIGALVDQSWALLIGIGFICTRYFTENQKDTRLIEFLLLKFIRWFLFLMAILYLFLIPLVVLDSFRMNEIVGQQVAQEQNAKVSQINQVQDQSSKIKNPAQLRLLAQSLNISQNELARIPDEKLPESIQQQLSTLKDQLKKQSAIALQNQLQKLWQNSVRMIFAQILLAVIFLFIWSKFGSIGKLDMSRYDDEIFN